MAKIKLTKSVVDAAQAQTCDVELRDTIVPGFLCKITPTRRKVFMLQYRTNSGVRRKPALGQFGELTVEQARSLAQDWLAEVRRGGDPGHDKAEARKAPTVKELCSRFMEDHSKLHNKPSTQKGYQYQIDRFIVPAFGSKKTHEVRRWSDLRESNSSDTIINQLKGDRKLGALSVRTIRSSSQAIALRAASFASSRR